MVDRSMTPSRPPTAVEDPLSLDDALAVPEHARLPVTYRNATDETAVVSPHAGTAQASM